MDVFIKYIVVWERALDYFPKVVYAQILSSFTVFEYASRMFNQHRLVMIDHIQIDESTLIDFTDQADWETVQDALDNIIEPQIEELNVKE